MVYITMIINGLSKFNKISVSKLENKKSNPIEEKTIKLEQTPRSKVSGALLGAYSGVVSFRGAGSRSIVRNANQVQVDGVIKTFVKEQTAKSISDGFVAEFNKKLRALDETQFKKYFGDYSDKNEKGTIISSFIKDVALYVVNNLPETNINDLLVCKFVDSYIDVLDKNEAQPLSKDKAIQSACIISSYNVQNPQKKESICNLSKQFDYEEAVNCFAMGITSDEKIEKYTNNKNLLSTLNNNPNYSEKEKNRDAALCSIHSLDTAQVEKFLNLKGLDVNYIHKNKATNVDEPKIYKLSASEAAFLSKDDFDSAKLSRYAQLRNLTVKVEGVRTRNSEKFLNANQILSYIKTNKSNEDIEIEHRLYALLDGGISKKEAILLSKSQDLTKMALEEDTQGNRVHLLADIVMYQQKGFTTEQQINIYKDLKEQGKDEDFAVNIALTGNENNVEEYIKLTNSGLSSHETVALLSDDDKLQRYHNFLEAKMPVDIKDISQLAELGFDNFEQFEAYKQITSKYDDLAENVVIDLATNVDVVKVILGENFDFSNYSKYYIERISAKVNDTANQDYDILNLKEILNNLKAEENKEKYQHLFYNGKLSDEVILSTIDLATNIDVTKAIFGENLDFCNSSECEIAKIGKAVEDGTITPDNVLCLKEILNNLKAEENREKYKHLFNKGIISYNVVSGAIGFATNIEVTKSIFGENLDFGDYSVEEIIEISNAIEEGIITTDNVLNLKEILDNLKEEENKEKYQHLFKNGELSSSVIYSAIGFATNIEVTKSIFGENLDFGNYSADEIIGISYAIEEGIITTDNFLNLKEILGNLKVEENKEKYQHLVFNGKLIFPDLIGGVVGLATNLEVTKAILGENLDFSDYSASEIRQIGREVQNINEEDYNISDLKEILNNLKHSRLVFNGQLTYDVITLAINLATNIESAKIIFGETFDSGYYSQDEIFTISRLIKDGTIKSDNALIVSKILKSYEKEFVDREILQIRKRKLSQEMFQGIMNIATNPDLAMVIFGENLDFSKYTIDEISEIGLALKNIKKEDNNISDLKEILDNLKSEESKEKYQHLFKNGELSSAAIYSAIGFATNLEVTKAIFGENLDISGYCIDELANVGELIKDGIIKNDNVFAFIEILNKLKYDKDILNGRLIRKRFTPIFLHSAVNLASNIEVTKTIFGQNLEFSRYFEEEILQISKDVKNTSSFTPEQTKNCIKYIEAGIELPVAIKMASGEKYQKMVDDGVECKLSPEQAAFFALNTSLTSLDKEHLKQLGMDVFYFLNTGESETTFNKMSIKPIEYEDVSSNEIKLPSNCRFNNSMLNYTNASDNSKDFSVQLQKPKNLDDNDVLFIKKSDDETYIAYDGAIALYNNIKYLESDKNGKLVDSLKPHANIDERQAQVLAEAAKHFILDIIEDNGECIISKGIDNKFKPFVGKNQTTEETKNKYKQILEDSSFEVSAENILKIMPKDAMLNICPYATSDSTVEILYSISAQWYDKDGVLWDLHLHSDDLKHISNNHNWVYRLGYYDMYNLQDADKISYYNPNTNAFEQNSYFSPSTHIPMNLPSELQTKLISNPYFQDVIRKISMDFSERQNLDKVANALGITTTDVTMKEKEIIELCELEFDKYFMFKDFVDKLRLKHGYPTF